jgi:hypothetical protein
MLEILLNAPPETADVMQLPWQETDRGVLAAILLKEDEDLTAERLEGAVRALKRMQIKRRLEEIQGELQRRPESDRQQSLLQEKMRLKRALMDPGLSEERAAVRTA